MSDLEEKGESIQCMGVGECGYKLNVYIYKDYLHLQ